MKCSKCGYTYNGIKYRECPHCAMAKHANVFEDVKDDASYAWYVTKHKANIVKPMLEMGLPLSQALKHDLSKYGPKEFGPYRDWFVGPKGLKGTQDPQVHTRWREAVNHHYFAPANLHHWRKIDAEHPEKFPLVNRMESVADWYSTNKTNRTTKKFPSFKTWFKEREDKLPVDIFAKKEIERNLGLSKAASIMTKIAGPRLLGSAVGAVAGGVLGSNLKDKQGNGTLGAVGGALAGGALGALSGNAWAGMNKGVTKATSKAVKAGTTAGKVTATAAKNVPRVTPPGNPGPEHKGLLDMSRNFLANKMKANEQAVSKGSKATSMFQNPYTKNPKRISGNAQIVPQKGTKFETPLPTKRNNSGYSSLLPGPVSQTNEMNIKAGKSPFTVSM